jgi:NAD(P)H-nitrite reductase large subunit
MNAAYVIVGASLAGAKAAEALREEGFDGPVVLIGEETERPYERPPLSKDYLMGKAERETIYVHPRAWCAEHDVDLRLGARVAGTDPAAHEVRLADGSRAGYAKLGRGRVLAGMNVNIGDVNEVIQAIVRSGRSVDVSRLADPDVPLEELL